MSVWKFWPREQRDLFIYLYFVKKLPSPEIADLMGLTPQMVTTRASWVRRGSAVRKIVVAVDGERQEMLVRLEKRYNTAEDRRAARLAAYAARESTVTNRPCLMCSGVFASSGAGQRVCPSCKDTEIWQAGVA